MRRFEFVLMVKFIAHCAGVILIALGRQNLTEHLDRSLSDTIKAFDNRNTDTEATK